MGSDSDFTWKDFIAKNNNELLANLGNFANRTLKFFKSEFGGVVPQDHPESRNAEDEKDAAEWEKAVADYITSMEERDLKSPLATTLALSSAGNKFLQKNKPWDLAHSDRNRCQAVIHIVLALNNLLATLLEPFVPGFSAKLLQQLNLPKSGLHSPDSEGKWLPKFFLPEGHKMSEDISPIVTEIPESRLDEFYDKFGCLSLVTFKLRLKVGKISSVDVHPQGGGRYLCKVDVGEAKERTIVSALQSHYSPEQLKDRKVVVFTNLKAINLGGVKSEGMLLTSKLSDGSIVLLSFENSEQVPVGSLIGPKGETY